MDEEHAARSDSLDKLTELTALDPECSINLNHPRWCEITKDGAFARSAVPLPGAP
jgi:hypothetical protein